MFGNLSERQKIRQRDVQNLIQFIIRDIIAEVVRVGIAPKPLDRRKKNKGSERYTPLQVLKREVVRTRGTDMEKGGAYRTMLIQAIHTCAVRFPDIAER